MQSLCWPLGYALCGPSSCTAPLSLHFSHLPGPSARSCGSLRTLYSSPIMSCVEASYNKVIFIETGSAQYFGYQDLIFPCSHQRWVFPQHLRGLCPCHCFRARLEKREGSQVAPNLTPQAPDPVPSESFLSCSQSSAKTHCLQEESAHYHAAHSSSSHFYPQPAHCCFSLESAVSILFETVIVISRW